MTKRKWVILASLALLLVAGAVVLAARIHEAGSLPPQPIAFNHRLHLERVQGIACPDCHQFVASQTYAGLPSKLVCFGCHDPEAEAADPAGLAAKPVLARLMAFARTDDDIPWQRVTAIRPDVFFSHRRHVTVAKLDCRICHSEMPQRTSPPTRGPLTMKMATCLECHNKDHASVDCVSCHR
jgi:hypothetical protein